MGSELMYPLTLLISVVCKMFDRGAVIWPWEFSLKVLYDIKKTVYCRITIGVSMNLKPYALKNLRKIFKHRFRHHPNAFVSIKVTGRPHLR